MTKTHQRINEDIHRELSALLRNVKDPRLKQGMISVTAVDCASDLSKAKVYLSVYGLQSEKDFNKGLKSASGHIRYELGQALKLRHTPELTFILDESIEQGSKINAILTELDIKESRHSVLANVSSGDDGIPYDRKRHK